MFLTIMFASVACDSFAGDVVVAGANDPEYRAELYRPAAHATLSCKKPILLKPGPHLLIDDYLIDKTENVHRRLNSPARDASVPNPLITGKEDLNWQPYMTVLRDAETGRFRLWYNARREDLNHGRSHLAVIESDDGLHWRRPPRVADDPMPIGYGASVIDEGPNCSDPAARYKFGWWVSEGVQGGLHVAVSPDGLHWKMLAPGPLLIHRDIMGLYYDDVSKQYVAIVADVRTDGPTWKGVRRLGMQSISRDLIHWEKPWCVLTPDDATDPPETQFYVMGGWLVRGDLRLAMVRVLHDNLRAEGTPEGSFGLSHTQLAWSRDGKTWTRDQTPYFEPDPTPGAWDHAHAWIGAQVLAGDDVYLYYCGYKNGHKVNRFEERQIGLVRIKRDRYVSRDADGQGGTLITNPLVLQGSGLTVNACISGKMQIRLLDEAGSPIPGFEAVVRGDGVALPVEWKCTMETVKDKPVRIEFQMSDARLYAFDLTE